MPNPTNAPVSSAQLANIVTTQLKPIIEKIDALLEKLELIDSVLAEIYESVISGKKK